MVSLELVWTLRNRCHVPLSGIEPKFPGRPVCIVQSLCNWATRIPYNKQLHK